MCKWRPFHRWGYWQDKPTQRWCLRCGAAQKLVELPGCLYPSWGWDYDLEMVH